MSASAIAAKAASSPSPDWKQRLASERRQAREHFLAHPSPPKLLRSLRAAVDRELRAVWKSCALPPGPALLAVGGYGRGELYPHSDVDLLVLLPHAANAALERQLEHLVGMLWDIGLEVGHSVR